MAFSSSSSARAVVRFAKQANSQNISEIYDCRLEQPRPYDCGPTAYGHRRVKTGDFLTRPSGIQILHMDTCLRVLLKFSDRSFVRASKQGN